VRVLVIDTALGACTAAVFAEGAALAARSDAMARGHQERLPVLARDAMAEAGLAFGDIERIGVTVGPGSFTGLRVGLSFALGLGAALERPVIGVPTLDALAAAVDPAGVVLAAIDARRGQAYVRLFRDGAPVSAPEALPLEAAAELARARPGPVRLVGDAGSVLAPLIPGAVEITLAAPPPEALARLTAALDPAAFPPRPLYLRAPDATPPTRLPGQPRVAP
jgi:tRNA threonylcarbamoyladenosine biosynthesis protein TsaB